MLNVKEAKVDRWRDQGDHRGGDEGSAQRHLGHRDHPGPGPAHQAPHALEGDRRGREAICAAWSNPSGKKLFNMPIIFILKNTYWAMQFVSSL